MARVIFEVPTLEQAKVFADWYEGQGEQNADVWFECRQLDTPITNCFREGGCIEVQGDDVIVYCK